MGGIPCFVVLRHKIAWHFSGNKLYVKITLYEK